MDPPANHHERLSAIHDHDWFNYFNINIHQDDQPALFSDDILEHRYDMSEIFHELVFDQNISPLKQDQNGFQNFDSLEGLSLWDCWDDCLQLVSVNDDSSECHGEATGSSGGATTDDGGRKVAKRTRPVELEEIEKCFEMPIVMAAKELGIGLTALKKRCRDFNIKRWPHRKLKSLQSLIQNVKELGLEQEEIKMLEGHKKMMEKLPDLQFTERTKKLRQACFKANYKKRRLNYP